MDRRKRQRAWFAESRERKSQMAIWKAAIVMAIATSCAFAVPQSRADDVTTFEVSVKGHEFQPAEFKAAAGAPIVFKVKNMSEQPVEFESDPLQFEMIVKPNAEIVVKVKPQKPGRYVFFDDLHQETKGTLIVE
jgi:plastocyanin